MSSEGRSEHRNVNEATSGLLAWVEVDLAALRSNARLLREVVPAPARLGILVKANGYGHGMVMSARAALEGGADTLVVATLGEGLELRASGIEAPVVVVYPVLPDRLGEAAEAGLEVSASGLASARELAAAWDAARVRPRTLRVHVEMDSGMARGGASGPHVLDAFAALERTPDLEIVGLWTHLADGSSAGVTARQVESFEAASAAVAASRRPVPPRHATATEGLFAGTAPVYDLARIGLAFYGELGLGVTPSPAMASAAARLRPAMSVKARPVHLEEVPAGTRVGYGGEWTAPRTSRIATLPVGYADGWSRRSWPGGEALVRGRRVPLVGRVSMDSVCVDVTDVDGVGLGEEFVLLGRQGEERISVDDLSRLRGTIPNEVMTSLGPRLPRVYLDAAEPGADGG